MIKRLLDAGINLDRVLTPSQYLRQNVDRHRRRPPCDQWHQCGSSATATNRSTSCRSGQGVLNVFGHRRRQRRRRHRPAPLRTTVRRRSGSAAPVIYGPRRDPRTFALDAVHRATQRQDGRGSAAGRCPSRTPMGTVEEHRLPPPLCRVRRLYLGTVCFDTGEAVRAVAIHAHQRPPQDRSRAGPIHALLDEERRLGARRHHRPAAPVDEGRPRVRCDAQRAQHRSCPTRSAAGETTHQRAVLAVQDPQPDRLASVFPDAAAVGRFRFATAPGRESLCAVAGTGTRASAGVEIAVPTAAAVHCGPRPPAQESCPQASAPATRCASRRPCHFTVTSSDRASPPSGGTRVGRGVGQGRVPWSRGLAEAPRAPPPTGRDLHRGTPPAPSDCPVLVDARPRGG